MSVPIILMSPGLFGNPVMLPQLHGDVSGKFNCVSKLRRDIDVELGNHVTLVSNHSIKRNKYS